MAKPEFYVIIPARYESSRLTHKVLRDIAGRPMLEYVYRLAKNSQAADVIIATDHERIYDVASSFGAKVCMTDVDHASGTSRIAQAVDLLGLSADSIIVNIQGDEPLLPYKLIDQVADNLNRNRHYCVTTLAAKMVDCADFVNPNVVKVLPNKSGKAMYFSRAPIPYNRDQNGCNLSADSIGDQVCVSFRHIGIYAYTVGVLRQYSALAPSPIEDIERIEQLRFLWHDIPIYVSITLESLSPSVDTIDDLQKVEAIIQADKAV